MRTIETPALDDLWSALIERGFQPVGPKRRDAAIVYDELASPRDLPIGWTDRQDDGNYRLEKRADGAFFGYHLGPQSWKKYFFPPDLRLWRAQRGGKSFRMIEEERPEKRYALIGVRACELAALATQDRVFLGGEHVDPVYRERRQNAFVVAVQCTAAGGTCFCASTGTGPSAAGGYDLALTEMIDGERHYFLAEAGSDAGTEVLAALPSAKSTEEEHQAAAAALEHAANHMGRGLETEGLQALLYHNQEHPHWDEVAKRCLACANCTLACPTCFCSTVSDTTDLKGENAERWRHWDSCFTSDFSHLHGGSVRASRASRYRQWMTHKLATWIDQFGTLGCVGCGRCITWCPVGIDITAEARALRSDERRQPEPKAEKGLDSR